MVSNNSPGVFAALDKNMIGSLEARKARILRLEEEFWRVKICVV